MIAQIDREIQTMYKISHKHPNIIKLYYHFENKDNVYQL